MIVVLAVVGLAAAALTLLWVLPHILLWDQDNVHPLLYIWHSLREDCKPQRAPHTATFRCECGRTAHSLDTFPGHENLGDVPPKRRVYKERRGA